jgi:hypothetical protein
MVKSTSYEALHYASLSNLLSLHLLGLNILLHTLFSNTFSLPMLPLMSEITFQSHKNHWKNKAFA